MPTKTRIATVCQDGQFKPSVEANRQHILELVDIALREKPDLVCLPEAFTDVGFSAPLEETAEPIDGPTVAAFGKRAREARCYIVCPIHTRQGGRIYNSSLLIDRAGEVCGVYNKACPVTTSCDYTLFEDGIAPGDALPVFDVDFGRIGLQICFDVGFPENWQALADKGARMVLWSSAYDGGFPLRAYAYLHHYYVVSSTRTPHSRIVDPVGEILCETRANTLVLIRDVNLDFVVAHLDWNLAIPERIQAAYDGRVDVRQWDKGSAHFIVEPMEACITTAQLQEEFGFESTTEYHDRHRAGYGRIHAGQEPLPQQARHGKRPQWGK